MTDVIFYEKPGCKSGIKQQALLEAHGHQPVRRNLLLEAWQTEHLRAFFAERPVKDWFNPTAPRIKSGAINPATLDEATALALMLEDPLLIRRPLLEISTPAGPLRCCGFESGPLLDQLGITLDPDEDLQACPRHSEKACEPPGRCIPPQKNAD